MSCAVMIVLVHVPLFFDQLYAQQAAQHDEPDTHRKLCGHCDRFRNRYTENEHKGSHKQQHHCMAQPPTQADQARCTPRWPLRKDRCYRGNVVRIQGMAKPKDETKHQDCHI